MPRTRTRSERPGIPPPETHPHASLYASTSSSSRIGDLPTRLSGWFTHAFTASNTDLSLPSLLAQSAQPPSSPKGKGASALLTAAKHGKGQLDKAMRYLLDSDATPDKCTDPIWLLGVQHSGYEPPPTPSPSPLHSQLAQSAGRQSPSSPSLRSSTSSTTSNSSNPDFNPSQSISRIPNPAANWPPAFYLDFTSRVWVTYRSHFTPIKDTRLADLSGTKSSVDVPSSPSTTKSRPWNWIGEKAWTSDSGWGCMLRTGQSLLANALIHLHLGRDWRRPPHPAFSAEYATYVHILTWFFDTPSPEAPFSVHRMALAGKELGTDVGQWFGPSIAAGAIKTLINLFPEARLGVSVATDGVLFQTDVFAASHGPDNVGSPERGRSSSWGGRPVLLLLGIRLGLECVNPVYYETIKLLYTFPQSVGIAGGRPSSSYYFVGSQADNLFYLDPHHARTAIPLRPLPTTSSCRNTHELNSSRPKNRHSSNNPRQPTSPSSTRPGPSTFPSHAPISPSPLQQQLSNENASTSSNPHARLSLSSAKHHGRWRSASQPLAIDPQSEMDPRELDFLPREHASELDPVQEHYVTSYNPAELKTFHCERVRKMPMSGLDPSMLIGFICRDEADWRDFRKRIMELPRAIFSVQEEPPTWPSDLDDNMGLESISEPDDMDVDAADESEGNQFFDLPSSSAATSSSRVNRREADCRGKSEEIDTEEDPVDPVTPGLNTKFNIRDSKKKKKEKFVKSIPFDAEGYADRRGNDIEDDWIDPSLPTPTPSDSAPPVPSKDALGQSSPLVTPTPISQGRSSGGTKTAKKSKKQTPVPVPVVTIPPGSQEHYPFPVSFADESDMKTPQERMRNSSNKIGKRMHTARARDGGRTQSGGVKGILTEE